MNRRIKAHSLFGGSELRFSLAFLTAIGLIAAVGFDTLKSAELETALQSQSSWDGIYSESQAERGEILYVSNCVVCHGPNLLGGQRAPAIGGPALTAKWITRSPDDLLDYMQLYMPLNSPGGLSRQQNSDILAFMLHKSGIEAGSKDFYTPDNALVDVATTPSLGPVATPSDRRAEAFYTEDQATRGKLAFNRNCAFCHRVNPEFSTPEDLIHPLPSTFGGHFLERIVNGKRVYPSAFYLYSKLESMPAFDTNAISAQTRADIAAYIMKMNDLPSGNETLIPDSNAMKLMMLNEPGFERIFNGKDFSGMKFTLGPNCQAAPIGCGKTDPGDILWVENETIVCACNIHGYWYTEKRYKDFTLRFDTRFERPSNWSESDDDELFSGGGGFLLFADVTVGTFPRSIEIEGRHRDFLEVFAINGTADWSFDLEARRSAIKRLGEWNAIEIVAKNGQVHSYLNGALISTITQHNYTEPGHIAFQVQGSKTYWRNMRIKVE